MVKSNALKALKKEAMNDLFNYPYEFPGRPLEIIKEDEEREMVLWSAEDIATRIKKFEKNINLVNGNKQ